MTILLLKDEELAHDVEVRADVIWRWDHRRHRLVCVKNREGGIGQFASRSESVRELLSALLVGALELGPRAGLATPEAVRRIFGTRPRSPKSESPANRTGGCPRKPVAKRPDTQKASAPKKHPAERNTL